MKTKTCRICLEDKPLKEFRMATNGSKKPHRRTQCRECENEAERDRKQEIRGPKVLRAEYFETLSESRGLWPAERVFSRAEFMGCIKEGTWPPGLRVKDERGKKYEVCLQLRRLK